MQSGDSMAARTHPVDASLDHLLFCKQKRGKGNFYFFNFSLPSLPLAVERVAGRSDGRVSKFCARHSRKCIALIAWRRGLTRSTLRWTTFSFASKKEGRGIFIF